MAHQIMGNGGIDVDMTSGRPAAQVAAQVMDAKKLAAVEKYRRVQNEAADLENELYGGNPVLKMLFRKMQERLTILAGNDEVLKSFAEMAKAIEFKLEVMPLIAKQEALRILGPKLSSLLGETEDAP